MFNRRTHLTRIHPGANYTAVQILSHLNVKASWDEVNTLLYFCLYFLILSYPTCLALPILFLRFINDRGDYGVVFFPVPSIKIIPFYNPGALAVDTN